MFNKKIPTGSFNNKILDKTYVIARTIMSQQNFYLSKDCNSNY